MKSEKLYTQGHIVGLTSLDYIQGRMIPFQSHTIGEKVCEKVLMPDNRLTEQVFRSTEIENKDFEIVKNIQDSSSFPAIPCDSKEDDEGKDCNERLGEIFGVNDVYISDDDSYDESLQQSLEDIRGGIVRHNEAPCDKTSSTSQRNQLQYQQFAPRKTWSEKKMLIQKGSIFGHLGGWVLKSFIVKVGDDLQKEMLAMQLIDLFRTIFAKERSDVKLRPYQIVCIGQSSGLVEFVEEACSVDTIKKSSHNSDTSLQSYFQHNLGLGQVYSPMFGAALQNFYKSLAGYCLVTYLLQVKDRHNANIMIQDDGSLFHIDFGFIFGDSPGFNLNFENAPFKLTKEYVDLMGGLDSSVFRNFQDVFVDGNLISLSIES